MVEESTQAVSERLNQIAERLRGEEQSVKIRVREFLGWFGAHRRGFNIVERIRAALQSAQLQTVPDFEIPHIDAEIQICLVREPDTTTRRHLSDPIWRIRRLRAADKSVVSVSLADTLEVAIAKMLLNDYSQLPVMNGIRDVKGAITWTSIGKKLAFGTSRNIVEEFLQYAHVIDGNTPMLEAIPDIVKHQFVLVRGEDRRITGIITTSDLSEEFREQAEPFLILREIEHQIRQFIRDFSGMSDSEIMEFLEKIKEDGHFIDYNADMDIHDLTFGDYVRIMENTEWWGRLNIPLDRSEVIKKLRGVQKIRNSFMHFDPDTFDRDFAFNGEVREVLELRRMNTFFQSILQTAALARTDALREVS